MTPLRRALKMTRLWRDQRGATAVEYALILPGLVTLTLGTINLSLMMWAVATLHFAVEDAARCGVVKTATCSSATTTQTYAAGQYVGPLMSPTFTADPANACGYRVSATATYNFVTGLANIPVSMSAAACRPLN